MITASVICDQQGEIARSDQRFGSVGEAFSWARKIASHYHVIKINHPRGIVEYYSDGRCWRKS